MAVPHNDLKLTSRSAVPAPGCWMQQKSARV
jgi:hypothetical protein